MSNTGGGTNSYGLLLFRAATLAAHASLHYTITLTTPTAKTHTLLIAGTLSATTDPNLRNNLTATVLTTT